MSAYKRPVCFLLLLALLAVAARVYAQSPPPLNQCRRFWQLTTVQDFDYGGFSVESGSASITMNSTGGLTTSGAVSLSSSIPATVWTIDVTNTLDPACATYGFILESGAVRDLLGPGASIPHDNLRFSAPDYSLSDVAFPQTIAGGPGNTAPFTMTVYGEINVTSPQAAGEYSRRLNVRLRQSNRRSRIRTDVTATSIVPLSISETVPMDFGTIAGGLVPGTVVLSTGGSRSASGDVQLLATGPGSAATFSITGEPGQTYALSYGNGVLANGGGAQMSVSGFTDNAPGTIPGSSSDSFQVGATLNVGSNQPAGNYSTTGGGGSPYTITINYN